MDYIFYTSLILAVASSASALDCLKCMYFKDLQVSIPGYEDMEDTIKNSIAQEMPSDSSCGVRNVTETSQGISSMTCPMAASGDTLICEAADIRFRVGVTMPAGNKKLQVSMTARLMVRGCSDDIGKPQEIGCYDINRHKELVQNLLQGLAQGGQDVRTDLAGYMCLCNENNCNMALPEQEPGPISASSTLGISSLFIITALAVYKMLA